MTSLVLPGRFRAAIFDLDGLLLDSEGAWETAERHLVVSHGGEFTDADRIATIGRSIDESVAIYGARIGWPLERLADLRSELTTLVKAAYKTAPPQPGAIALVNALRRRIPIALASNTDSCLVDVALAAAGLANAFDAVVTADDVTKPKPAPDPFVLACARLRIPPGQAIAFEDSGVGVRSAKAAGLFVVAVPSIAAADLSEADLVLPSLTYVGVA